MRQADSSKCARCDRLELECRFVEKKRGRKPKNQVPPATSTAQVLDHTASTQMKQTKSSRSPSYSLADNSQSVADSPSPTTTFTPPPPHTAAHAPVVGVGPFHQVMPPPPPPALNQSSSQQQQQQHQQQQQQQQRPQSSEQEHLRNGVADDPVKAGLISSTEIPRLFEYFMQNREFHRWPLDEIRAPVSSCPSPSLFSQCVLGSLRPSTPHACLLRQPQTFVHSNTYDCMSLHIAVAIPGVHAPPQEISGTRLGRRGVHRGVHSGLVGDLLLERARRSQCLAQRRHRR